MAKLPLNGIVITDFCWIGAGSFTTKILADMGADVIKIESESHLDSLRVSPPFKDGIPGVNRSGYFADRNSSKRSFTLNMKHPRALPVIRKLISQSDVVTNNFTPGVMERFGLGFDEVRALNPSIIYVAMSMQGQSGPEKDYLGYGLTIGALTGLQHLTGKPGMEPAGTGTNYPDHIPNPCHAAFAILAALRSRRVTGKGQMIDIAQTEPTLAVLGTEMMLASVRPEEDQPRGNHHISAAPHGVFPCAGEDRWIAISATDDESWARFAVFVGPPLQDGVFSEPAQRFQLRERLNVVIGDFTRRWDAYELMEKLQAIDIAAGVVQSPSDIVDRDPQLKHRGHWHRMGHPSVGPMLYNAPPYRFSRAEVSLRGPAPLLGEHTDEIACEKLGWSEEDIASANADGVLS